MKQGARDCRRRAFAVGAGDVNRRVVALGIGELGQGVANGIETKNGLVIGRQSLKVDVGLKPTQRFRVRGKTHGLTRATSSRRLSHFVGRRFVLTN